MAKTADVILVAVDFEDTSTKALATAKSLARRMGAEIVLIHVYSLPTYSYPGLAPALLPSLAAEIGAGAKRALDQLAASAGGLRSVLREGDPSTEILREVDATQPRLVVLGTHGRHGLSRVLIGSVAEQVVRRSPVPVLTVRGE